MNLDEHAPAKLNLSLKVLGRRADGFHEIESLVTFATFSDLVSLNPTTDIKLETSGPFASVLGEGDNLILDVARRMSERYPGAQFGAFSLGKNIPVAAGLGGGSADAAAALRLIGRANPGMINSQVMEEMACELGSDILACLMSHATVMRGRGEKLTSLENMPVLDVVLVNPGVQLAAGEVYSALNAPLLEDNFVPGDTDSIHFASASEVLEYISSTRNDLQEPAIKLAPVIGDVLTQLSDTEGCQMVQMSGSGSTCFGVFANAGHAAAARDVLRAAHPGWWVVSTRLG
jgi:4-diphosphocytidyl-2-C-methyl-D-erythritol kinase